MTDDEWKAGVDRWRDIVDKRLQAIEMVNAVDEVHRQNTVKRLAGIEGTLQWLVRLIVGAMILAALGYALGGGLQVV